MSAGGVEGDLGVAGERKDKSVGASGTRFRRVREERGKEQRTRRK